MASDVTIRPDGGLQEVQAPRERCHGADEGDLVLPEPMGALQGLSRRSTMPRLRSSKP
jgi:hypothetical protein